MANLVVYKGDDTTGIFGRHLQFTITVQEGVSLVGCVAKFTVHKITKSWSNITPGQQVEIIYTHDETASMPVGGTYGIFQIVDASNNIRTFDDSVPFLVTNDIRQVYPGSSQATVYVGQMIKWTDIAGRPATVVQKVNNTPPDTNGNVNVEATLPSEWNTVKTKALSAMQHSEFASLSQQADLDPDEAGIRSICTMINTIKNLLKPQTALLALFAILSTTLSGAYVETNKLVYLLGKSNVVTAVSLEGLATTNELTTVKTNLEYQISQAGKIDDVRTNGVSIVSSKVADIYGPVRAIASSASVTNAGAVAVAAADATTKANAAKAYAYTVATNAEANAKAASRPNTWMPTAAQVGALPANAVIEKISKSGYSIYGDMSVYTNGVSSWVPSSSIPASWEGVYFFQTDPMGTILYVTPRRVVCAQYDGNVATANELTYVSGDPTYAPFPQKFTKVESYYSGRLALNNDIPDISGLAPKSMISATDATFSNATYSVAANSTNLWNASNTKLTATIDGRFATNNTAFTTAVLAVGLNIDTNAVAVLNEIASGFGGFPIAGTATTVGGLLAALAAAVAWLKRKTADIETAVGTANSDLEDALGGNS